MQLVLASSSLYRRELLQRLGRPFEVDAPDVDETHVAGESGEQLVRRLAEAKARAVAPRHRNALIVGSDQVAVFDSAILTKPHTTERAIEQLTMMRGATAHFLTGICLINTRTERSQVAVERYAVTFRTLSDPAIAAYVERERPLDCAGAFKSEGLGIALFESMDGTDPTTLVGLPLIRLTTMLAAEGFDVLRPR